MSIAWLTSFARAALNFKVQLFKQGLKRFVR